MAGEDTLSKNQDQMWVAEAPKAMKVTRRLIKGTQT